MPGTPRNQREIQVFGLQRSGNHAVIAWILQQFAEPVVFLNNVVPFTDPYTNFRAVRVPNMVPVSRGTPVALARIERLRLSPKQAVVISYENLRLRLLAERPLIEDPERVVGDSASIVRVLLLRDFFNWAASRLKLHDCRRQDVDGVVRRFDSMIDLWLSYAREFVGETSYLGSGAQRPSSVVPVAYGRWSRDAEYRAYCLGRMNVPMRSNDNSIVPDVGGGSSFDATAFSGNSGAMRTDRRWEYLRDPRFAPAVAAARLRRDDIERYNRDIFQEAWPDGL